MEVFQFIGCVIGIYKYLEVFNPVYTFLWVFPESLMSAARTQSIPYPMEAKVESTTIAVLADVPQESALLQSKHSHMCPIWRFP